jgi:hypothetical protein
MRFHLGSIPNSPDFDPLPPWRQLREPSPWVMQLFALPIGVALALVTAFLWFVLTPLRSESLSLSVPAVVALFVGIIIVHELVHAAIHPLSGRSSHSILGFSPSQGMFYAFYDGQLSRNRFVAILLMPLAVMSFVPLTVAAVTQTAVGWIAFASILNALFACGDVFAAGLVLSQLPASAIVRNQGYYTFWKPEIEA